MMLRSILSRFLRNGGFPSLCSVRRNGFATVASEESSVLQREPLENGYVISYLVNSCGFSQEKAISASRLLNFNCPDKPNAVLNFLENRGFTQPQIAALVGKLPKVLTYDLHSSILPKFEFLSRSTGFSESEIPGIVCAHPDLLKRSFKRKVEPAYNFIKGMIGAERVDNLIRGGCWIFNVDLETRIMPNVDLLREFGVPPEMIKFALTNCTHIFLSDQVELRRTVEEVKDMGFDPLKSSFVLALRVRNGEGCLATWNRCFEVYSKWGWSEDDIRAAYMIDPCCMGLSEKKISRVMEFLVNKLGREPRSIARSARVLSYSLEMRIAPRCSVVHRLFLEGLVEEDWSLMSAVVPVEKKFLDKYVTRYIESIPELNDIYQSNKGSGVTRSSAVVHKDGP